MHTRLHLPCEAGAGGAHKRTPPLRGASPRHARVKEILETVEAYDVGRPRDTGSGSRRRRGLLTSDRGDAAASDESPPQVIAHRYFRGAAEVAVRDDLRGRFV